MVKKSRITSNLNECYVCGTTANIHIHHIIYGTANRRQSDKYGLTVPLCAHHHVGDFGVHGSKGRDLDQTLKETAQKVWEREIGTREEFREVFGKSFL